MAQNVFMSSMYFFIPINKVIRSIKWRTFQSIECATVFQNVSSSCQYLEIKEKHQKFYFNSAVCNDKVRERQIIANVYIVKYLPHVKEKKNVRYYLVIGVGIDKLFDVNNNTINDNDYCDEYDLVMLKQAFYSVNNKSKVKSGLYYPKNDSTIFHREWLSKLVKEYDKEPSDIIKFDASITDIRTVPLVSLKGITDRKKLDDIFEKCYVYSPCLSYDMNLYVDANQLAYGILVGNENYKRLPDDLIGSFIKNSYSNCLSERIFSASNSILFLRTHHPYIDPQKDPICSLSMTIRDLDERNIIELCHSLYLKAELTDIYNQVNKKCKPGIIKEAMDKLAYLLKFQLFNFHEADKRVESIFCGLGVLRQSQETEKLVKTYLENKRFSYTKNQSNWMGCLTFATVIIGILAIIVPFFKTTIQEHFKHELYFGDFTYPRWVGYLYLFIYLLFAIPLFVFFIRLKMPLSKWLAIKIDSILNRIHKKAVGEE